MFTEEDCVKLDDCCATPVAKRTPSAFCLKLKEVDADPSKSRSQADPCVKLNTFADMPAAKRIGTVV